MRKLLFTTALSISLLSAGAGFAADTDKSGADTHQYAEGMMGHGKALESLPKDKADLFRASMKQVHQKNKEFFKQMKGLHGELNEITKAASFDKKTYIAKTTEITNLQNTMRANKAEAMADFLSKLDSSERAKFADSMKAMKHGHKGMGAHHKGAENTGAPASDATKK